MTPFFAGAFVMGCLAVALFFHRFWSRSGDRLFAVFCLAFVLLAVERTVLAFLPLEHEGRHWIYLVRLLAFVLIIGGVLDKNRRRRVASP